MHCHSKLGGKRFIGFNGFRLNKRWCGSHHKGDPKSSLDDTWILWGFTNLVLVIKWAWATYQYALSYYLSVRVVNHLQNLIGSKTNHLPTQQYCSCCCSYLSPSKHRPVVACAHLTISQIRYLQSTEIIVDSITYITANYWILFLSQYKKRAPLQESD